MTEGEPRAHDAAALRPPYPIVTPRLHLRPFRVDDLDAWHRWYADPQVVRFLYGGPRDQQAARAEVERKIRADALREEGDRLALIIANRHDGAVVGDIVLKWLSREHRQGEIGFVLDPQHQGRGYATEAGEALLRLGFDGLGLHRVIGRCDARNSGSARVLERLGMRREAHFVHSEVFKGEWGDELVYALLDDEWRARSAFR